MTLTWYRRILAAKKRGGFTRDDNRDASDLEFLVALVQRPIGAKSAPLGVLPPNEPDAISSLGIRFAVAVRQLTTPPSPFASTVRSIA